MHLANYTYKIVLKLLLPLGDPPITCEIERVHFMFKILFSVSNNIQNVASFKIYNDFVLDILLNL